MREKTSRPRPSVPIQCVLEGGSRIACTSMALGSKGAINGAVIASSIIEAIMMKPPNDIGFDIICLIVRHPCALVDLPKHMLDLPIGCRSKLMRHRWLEYP